MTKILMTMRAAVAGGAVIAALSGCSIALQKHESNYTPDHDPRCSTNGGLPVLDGVMAIGEGVGVGFIAAAKTPSIADNAATYAVPLALLAALQIGSAIVGEIRVHRCDAYWKQWQAAHPTAVKPE